MVARDVFAYCFFLIWVLFCLGLLSLGARPFPTNASYFVSPVAPPPPTTNVSSLILALHFSGPLRSRAACPFSPLRNSGASWIDRLLDRLRRAVHRLSRLLAPRLGLYVFYVCVQYNKTNTKKQRFLHTQPLLELLLHLLPIAARLC